jgi:hypothetical protein
MMAVLPCRDNNSGRAIFEVIYNSIFYRSMLVGFLLNVIALTHRIVQGQQGTMMVFAIKFNGGEISDGATRPQVLLQLVPAE